MRIVLGILIVALACGGSVAYAEEGILERITSPSSAYIDQMNGFTRVGVEGDFYGDTKEEGLFVGTRSFSGLSGSQTMFGGRMRWPISSFEDMSNILPGYTGIEYAIVADAGLVTGTLSAANYEAQTSGLVGSIMLESTYSLSDSFTVRIGSGFGLDNISVDERFDVFGYTGTRATNQSSNGFMFTWGLSSQF